MDRTTLTLKCPVCGWSLRRILASNVATEFHRRTCRKCKALNAIKIIPKLVEGGIAHIAIFSPTRSPL